MSIEQNDAIIVMLPAAKENANEAKLQLFFWFCFVITLSLLYY